MGCEIERETSAITVCASTRLVMPGLSVNGPRAHAQFQAISKNRIKIRKGKVLVLN